MNVQETVEAAVASSVHPEHLLSKSARSSRVYRTDCGAQFAGDGIYLLKRLASNSIDLIVTSPPFALLREKSYGNFGQDAYVGWLTRARLGGDWADYRKLQEALPHDVVRPGN